MGIDGKHLVCEYVGAVRLRIILEQVQDKPGVPVDHGPVQGRTPSSVGQVAAASVEPENPVLKTVQNRLGNQPLPSHGNADLKLIFRKKTAGFLILQPVGMGLKHGDPILIRQIGKPLIAGHLIAGKHVAAIKFCALEVEPAVLDLRLHVASVVGRSVIDVVAVDVDAGSVVFGNDQLRDDDIRLGIVTSQSICSNVTVSSCIQARLKVPGNGSKGVFISAGISPKVNLRRRGAS